MLHWGRMGRKVRRRVGFRLPYRYLVMLRVTDPGINLGLDRLAAACSPGGVQRRVNHLTFAGPLTLKPGIGADRLCRLVEGSARGLEAAGCTLGGYVALRGRKGWAVAVRAEPARDFTALYRRFSAAVPSLCETCTWIDREPDRRDFHITVGSGFLHQQAMKVLRCIERGTMGGSGNDGVSVSRGPSRPGIPAGEPLTALRLSIARNGALWREYDLPCRRWLDRPGIYSREAWKDTLAAFRRRRGYELDDPAQEWGHAVFLIADLHLGHANIIRYCHRPFPDVQTMDEVLVRNWNCRVGPDDDVWFLGDLCYGPDTAPPARYLSLLRGNIHLVRGNHDQGFPGAPVTHLLEFGGEQFLLVHDPASAPGDFNGYTIHGHTHNNQCQDFPFLDRDRRRVNVSAELVGYVPVLLDEILDIIRASPPGTRFTTLREAREFLSGRGISNRKTGYREEPGT
jgi:calcineurin-like phosphoesterase family protein